MQVSRATSVIPSPASGGDQSAKSRGYSELWVQLWQHLWLESDVNDKGDDVVSPSSASRETSNVCPGASPGSSSTFVLAGTFARCPCFPSVVGQWADASPLFTPYLRGQSWLNGLPQTAMNMAKVNAAQPSETSLRLTSFDGSVAYDKNCPRCILCISSCKEVTLYSLESVAPSRLIRDSSETCTRML